MNYKEIPSFECPNEQCWLRDGECCKLDLALFRELEANDTLRNLQCLGSFFGMQKIRRYLEQSETKLPETTKEFADYKVYKQELDTELRKTTEGFVKIGYLLKVAKDTDILQESGYANVYEFAQAEYNIDKSQVSRFININDRFSEGGYSDRLKEQFQGFGHAKLTIMLQLPDEINEELTPGFTKSEIQAIKEEYDAEHEVTDLEVLMEGEDEDQKTMDSNLYKVLHQLGKEEPELYVKLFDALWENLAAVQEVLASDGEKIYSIRIMGVGRLMMSVKGTDRPITLTNMRTAEKEEYSWDNVMDIMSLLVVAGIGPEESWMSVYGEAFPKKTEVAPVQQNLPKKEAPKKEPPKKETKVKKAKKPEPKPAKPVEKTPETEEQIPGQDNVMNHPEYLPEEMRKPAEILNEEGTGDTSEAAVVENPIENVTKDSEIVDKTPLEEPEKPINTTYEPISPAAGEDEKSQKEELTTIWDNATLATAKLNLFFQNWSAGQLMRDELPQETLKNAYKNAISLAADLERILNHG